MSYGQLTQDERYQIATLHGFGLPARWIARRIGRDAATISRELRRNRSTLGYRAKTAHQMARARRESASRRSRFPESVWAQVEERLRRDGSPEQIVGRFRTENRCVPSHERIYQHIGHDRRAGGSLWRHLRCQKRRRRRYGSCRRGRFSWARSIRERPAGVEKRHRVGHWEADTMVSRQSKASLVTLVERKSRLLRLRRVENRRAETVTGAMVNVLGCFQGRGMSVTMDRGSEFADHGALEIALGTTTYFADPYSAWQRGTNENCNGLIRQYVPKGADIGQLSNEDVRRIEDRLNNCPRKALGFRTPNEVMDQSLNRVALRS